MNKTTRPHMTEEEIKQFKGFISKFCEAEGKCSEHCKYDGCEFCPVNEAYHFMFDEYDNMDMEDEDDG